MFTGGLWRQDSADRASSAAKEAALSFAGVSASNAVCTKLELEYDDGIAVYDVELSIDGTEYSFEINAASGEVLEMERETRY